ncbi:MAG: hypothetical protein HQL32_05160 [Planctomycetes bacterium]|nr:hypothetical protein [Planctomycetota bacterium]
MKIILLILFIYCTLGTEMLCAYQGKWSFVKEDFKKVHPWLPNSLINRALRTRLVLKEDSYAQFDHNGKLMKSIRELKVLKKKSESHWLLQRKEGNKQIEFEVYFKDSKWFYLEGKKTYQIEQK